MVKDGIQGIILSANSWKMEDEKSGQIREGISVQYILTDNLKPNIEENGLLGYKIAQETIPVSHYADLEKVPGIYDLQFGFNIVKNKPVAKLKSVQFISEV